MRFPQLIMWIFLDLGTSNFEIRFLRVSALISDIIFRGPEQMTLTDILVRSRTNLERRDVRLFQLQSTL